MFFLCVPCASGVRDEKLLKTSVFGHLQQWTGRWGHDKITEPFPTKYFYLLILL
jgi:hypothetical protein